MFLNLDSFLFFKQGYILYNKDNNYSWVSKSAYLHVYTCIIYVLLLVFHKFWNDFLPIIINYKFCFINSIFYPFKVSPFRIFKSDIHSVQWVEFHCAINPIDDNSICLSVAHLQRLPYFICFGLLTWPFIRESQILSIFLLCVPGCYSTHIREWRI